MVSHTPLPGFCRGYIGSLHLDFPEPAMRPEPPSKMKPDLPGTVPDAAGSAGAPATNGPPVRPPAPTSRADAARAKLAELRLSEADVEDAVAWARSEAKAE